MSVFLSKKLRKLGDLLMHFCPGCQEHHTINVVRDDCGPAWDWDGNAEAPTFTPSIHIVGKCHYFIRAGQIEYCHDSAHSLAGKTVPLPDLPGA